MNDVHSIKEAESFFLSNSSDSVRCVDGDNEKVIDCYSDAVSFFEDKD